MLLYIYYPYYFKKRKKKKGFSPKHFFCVSKAAGCLFQGEHYWPHVVEGRNDVTGKSENDSSVLPESFTPAAPSTLVNQGRLVIRDPCEKLLVSIQLLQGSCPNHKTTTTLK